LSNKSKQDCMLRCSLRPTL